MNPLAIAFVLFAAVCYSTGGVLIRPISGSALELGAVSALAIGGFRSVIALPAFVLLVLFETGRDTVRRRFALLLPQLNSKWIWYSALSRSFNTLAFSTAVVFCAIADAYLICNSTIIGMIFWRWRVDRQSPKLWELLTALVVILACAARFYGDPHQVTFVGVIAGLIALFTFAGFFFFNDKIRQVEGGERIQSAIVLSHIITPLFAIALIGACALISPISADATTWARLWQPVAFPSGSALGMLLLLGAFQGALADWFLAKGQALKPDLLFMAFVPTLIMLWAAALARWIVGEPMFGSFYGIPFVVAHAAILYGALRSAQQNKLKIAEASKAA